MTEIQQPSSEHLSPKPRFQKLIEAIYKKLELNTICNVDTVKINNKVIGAFMEQFANINLNELKVEKTDKVLIITKPDNTKIEIKAENKIYKAIFGPEVHGEKLFKQFFRQAKEEKIKLGSKIKVINIKKSPTVLQAHLDDRYEKALKTKNDHISKLAEVDIKKLRSNRTLLTKNLPENTDESRINKVKTETARRLAAYTTKDAEGWYVLNYKDVKISHEMDVGLGDILIDEDIEYIEILKDGESTENGKPIIAHRGFTSNGRPCFLDDEGDYVTTFSNDKFRIISGKETNPKQEKQRSDYLDKLKTTEGNLKRYREHVKKYGITKKFRYGKSAIDIGIDEIKQAKSLKDDYIEKQLTQKNPDTNLDTKDLLQYAHRICKHFNVPWEIVREVINIESGWKIDIKSKKSTARGLGQFLTKSWRGFITEANKNGWKSEFGEKWGKDWDHIPKDGNGKILIKETHKGTGDPYAMMFATIWNLSKVRKLNPPKNINLAKKGILTYLVHHEGYNGAKHYLRFLKLMKENRKFSLKQIEEEYLKNPEKYNKVLYKTQVARIKKHKKGQKAGIKHFLSVYTLAKKIGARAAKASPREIDRIEKEFVSPKIAPSGWCNTWDNQENLVIGSSIALQLENIVLKKSKKTGTIGLGGFNALQALRVVEKNRKYFEAKPAPETITLVGLGINGLPQNIGIQVKTEIMTEKLYKARLTRRIHEHEKLITLLKAIYPNTKIVIAELHPYSQKTEAIAAFNKHFREKTNPNYKYMPISEAAKSERMHPKSIEYKAMAESLNLLENHNKTETPASLKSNQEKW